VCSLVFDIVFLRVDAKVVKYFLSSRERRVKSKMLIGFPFPVPGFYTRPRTLNLELGT
jgi:hypothetical protein